jgi:hypothetical protein
MKRIHFNVADFPNFIDATDDIIGWHESFISQGFKTYQFDYSGGRYGYHSLSEEEYTWFVLRWS